jgi:hypothetical protein
VNVVVVVVGSGFCFLLDVLVVVSDVGFLANARFCRSVNASCVVVDAAAAAAAGVKLRLAATLATFDTPAAAARTGAAARLPVEVA